MYYRESGFSGYQADDEDMQKHYKSCFDNTNGDIRNCTMTEGTPYSRCVDDCELELCPDENSQRDCTLMEDEDSRSFCEQSKKYCMKYETVFVQDGDDLGHIPMVAMCHDVYGLPTEDVGKVQRSYMPTTHDLAAMLSPFDGTYVNPRRELENCYYTDGETLVRSQHAEDEYGYCGGENGTKCNPFIGAFNHFTFDPRTQAYHLGAKERQEPYWTEPYAFFNNELGIGFIHPLYNIIDGKNVFIGVLGSDYIREFSLFALVAASRLLSKQQCRLHRGLCFHICPNTVTDITEYLQEVAAQGSNTGIAVFDENNPHYMIGASTGTLGLKKVLSGDDAEPCPDGDENASCVYSRVPMTDLMGTSRMNDILFKAFDHHNRTGYPKELISFKEFEDDADSEVFVAQVSLFESKNLRWRILIVSPAEKSSSESIQLGDPFFPAVFVISVLGFVICATLALVMYWKRSERAVAFSDWRFTCAFITGCALFNGSSFAVLGPNTNATCMVRMWMFHFFLVAALAPLFVKVWRIKELVGKPGLRKASISNAMAVMYTFPMLTLQFLILTLISIFDPPLQTEIIEENENVIIQYLSCDQDTKALTIVSLIYEGGLVFFGCLLAYQSRNLDGKFGESKQLIFAMYNILLVGVTFLILLNVADIDQRGQKLLLTIGVFWGTVVSSAAFVIPRLIQVRTAVSAAESVMVGRSRVSGLDQSGPFLNTSALKSSDMSAPFGVDSPRPNDISEPLRLDTTPSSPVPAERPNGSLSNGKIEQEAGGDTNGTKPDED